MTTFQELCADARVTPEEQRALATFLAVHRCQQTLQLLAGGVIVTAILKPAIERLEYQAQKRADQRGNLR